MIRFPSTSPASPAIDRIDAELGKIAPRMVEFRRHLHAHPELSLHEFATTAFIAATLGAEGIPCQLGSEKRGLWADLGEAADGSRTALRADCDALPIAEENTFPHASRTAGVMHACGHDAHSAMLLGATIAMHRAGAPVAIRGIFQPAEEGGDGALGIIADGALEGITNIVALHVDPALPVGHAAAVAGMQTASCQDFHIVVTGRGGHAARPHLSVDPVAAAAALVCQIYQVVPRRSDSRKPVVVSVCQIHAGHATNVIPDTAEISGTIRTLDNEAAEEARDALERVCRGIAEAHGATVAADFKRRIPGVANDPAVTAACAKIATRMLGPENVLTAGPASLGAEDFADYLQLVPGCMMRLGVKYPDRAVTPLHTPDFDIDERALIHGARLLLHSALTLSHEPC